MGKGSKLKKRPACLTSKFSLFILILSIFLSMVINPSGAMAVNAAFDVKKMGDMSDFDPNNPAAISGDTIKIAVVASFSGPAAQSGQKLYICALWAAHDINKRGGLMVDGKMKLIQIIKADHMSKPDQCKKICERMALQEKVHVLWGTDGSNLMKIMNEVGTKYKIIVSNTAASTDELMDATNFTRYAFMSSWTTGQFGRNLAYFYGQIRKKEKKFYILCQDYMSGHSFAAGFKQGLKDYYPEAQVVGEDYHKLFLTDFAPYLTKIKASGAEVIFTGDWIPDITNLVKQARAIGVKLPVAQGFLTDVTTLEQIGIEGTQGLVETNQYDTDNPFFKTPDQIKYYKTWNNLWKTKWSAPYNTVAYEHPAANIGSYIMQTYWLLSVIERAGSLDPEKIIKIWEGDSYQYVNGKVVKMRSCDHKVIQDLSVSVYVPPDQQKVSFNIPPYYWEKNCSYWGPTFKIPADKVLPIMDQKLDRCKGKSEKES
ncbi:MAG TPA: ABC transporter substrate-binding protein [Thermodesulfobacteriota bacterium]|nr:ABC transporter substrate-binding protein [Thermodesulfobacteriota bacterium]